MKFAPVRHIFLFGMGILLFALAMEGVLQFLPVYSRIQGMSTDDLFPIDRAQPNQPYVYSFGWDFLNVTTGQTNNVGMFNSADYVKGVPAVAVVGDSYIEARMLPYSDTLQGHLEKTLAHQGLSVFAASSGGAGLADYAGFAAMLRREISPRILVVLVSEGDILEALGYPDPGYMGMRCDAGKVSMFSLPYHRAPRTPLRKILGSSALLRYAEFNLKAKIWVQGLLTTHEASSATSELLSEACMSNYLRQLTALAGLDSAHILFIVDGLRGKYDARRDAQRLKQAKLAREKFMVLARGLGFPVIDMQPIFDKAKEMDRLRVDFNPRDNHWNGLGHKLAADVVAPRLIQIINHRDQGEGNSR
jgi:hypothetical protein